MKKVITRRSLDKTKPSTSSSNVGRIKKDNSGQRQETAQKAVTKSKNHLYNRVGFRFKDLNNPNIEYVAFYCPRSISGEEHSLDLTLQPGAKGILRNRAWTIFRENATFNNILEGMRTYDIHDIMATTGKPDFSDYNKWTDINFLKELSKHSEWLVFIETFAATRLCVLLKTAQVANNKKAKEVADNLHDWLIPGRRSGSKSYPENLGGCLFLLKDLSKYISRKCRSFLCGEKATDKYER